ncbi:MAG: PEP/pyruvate-binding domain-containing protein [Cyanobacteriota bacterium]
MYIIKHDCQIEVTDKIAGGKASNLHLLNNNGVMVPEWFVINASAFEKHLKILNDNNLSPETILNIELSTELTDEIEKTLDQLALKNKYLAVRSSAVGEDSSELSFAGQLESFLFVKPEDIFINIKKVWASSYSKRVKSYLKENNISQSKLKVAVIVQEMINAEISGVAFGIDPVSGNRDAVIISSVYGLGEGLVSGLLDSDTYVITKDNIESKIVKKTQAVRLNKKEGHSTIIEPIDSHLQNISSLSDSQIAMIYNTTRNINALYGRPQDIEWAIYKENLFILQARPITTLDSIADKSLAKRIWDNSNIVESYSGVTTPLTFSFISVVYTEVYKQFCRIMGVEESLIEKNSHIFSMIGLIKGRVYYNLINWYNLLALLPGYSINAGFMEQMMGVKEKLDIALTVIQSDKNQYIRLLCLIKTLLINLINIDKEIINFYKYLEQIISPYKNLDLNNESLDNLMNHYLHIENSLIRKWHAPLVNDFFAMIFYGVLKKVINKWDIDDHDTLQNDLMVGQGDIISTHPIKNIRNIANIICNNADLKEFFLLNNEQAILKKLLNYPEIHQKIRDHIDKFGDRCINELKLETITFRHNPEMLINIIKSYVKIGYEDPDKTKQNERQLKIVAERKAFEKIKNPAKTALFKYILNQARKRVKDRENLRYERTRVFALIREVFLAIGHKFYYENIINNERDIFYLSKEEIINFISGTAISANIKEIIKSRKEEFEGYKNVKLPDRFETYGPVYHANHYIQEQAIINDTGILKGTGCSPGIVKAIVKIVFDPTDVSDLGGNILVAERTDPGWVALFPLAKGVLIERGSILSHSAIVTREMGIPCIVGLNNITSVLKDGQLVEMDGTTGVVRIITEN